MAIRTVFSYFLCFYVIKSRKIVKQAVYDFTTIFAVFLYIFAVLREFCHFLIFYFRAIGGIIFSFYDFMAKLLFYDFITFYNIGAWSASFNGQNERPLSEVPQ